MKKRGEEKKKRRRREEEEEKEEEEEEEEEERYGTLWNLYGTKTLYGNFEYGSVCMDISGSISRV